MSNRLNLPINGDEVSLYKLIIIFWKEKFLILCCVFLFSILGLAYTIFRPVELYTKIVLNDPSVAIFEKYNKYFIDLLSAKNTNFNYNLNTNAYANTNNNSNNNSNNNTTIVARDIFLDIFRKNFLSIDNLNEFINSLKENDINLKNYLKKNDLISSSFFYGNKFGKVNIDKSTSYSGDQVFFLIYPEEIDGTKILNDYIFYIKKKSEIDFYKIVQLAISSKIDIKKDAFEIVKKINLQYLKDLKSSATYSLNNELINNINYTNVNYIILEQEINNLEKDLITIKEININFIPISQKSTPPIKNTKLSNYFIIISSILFGFFISTAIILFRLKKI